MELYEEVGHTTHEESVKSEHEALDPVHADNARSLKEELSSEEDLDEWLKEEMEKHMTNNTINNDDFTSNLPYQSSLEELNPGGFLFPFSIDNYNSYAMAHIDAKNNILPRSICEYLMLANLEEACMSVKMDDLMQQETLGTVKNILVKIDKFEFPCDFVFADMPDNLGEMIILGRPFLKTIHAQIDVFQEEISLGICKDRIKFGVNGNLSSSKNQIEKVYMENTSQDEESLNPLEIGQDLFSYESPACLQFEHDTRNYNIIDTQNEIARQTNLLLDKRGFTKRWHVFKPVQVLYDDGNGEDCGMWPTCNPNSSFCDGYKEVFEKNELGTLRQWVCFRDHKRRTVKGSCMGFADFLQIHYGNQRIDDTTRERRYYEWVAQNYKFDNNRIPSTTTVSEKNPYKIDHPTPIPLDTWDTRSHFTYKGSTSNQDILNDDPAPFSPEHPNFDIEEEYAKEIRNPYSRRFDEYKQVFDNEVEHLSNEYNLRIGKKG
ncbi:phospholipase-like protein, partial [Tanacetum coccineum]